jgi:hypothetical protein
MTELEAILHDIADMKEAIAMLKERLRGIPEQMASEIPSQTDRIEAARYLYWTQPDLSPTLIAEGLLDTTLRELLRLVGPSTTDIVCDRCGEAVPVSSRTNLEELRHRQCESPRYAEGYRVICSSCWSAVQRDRSAWYEQYEHQQRARFQELMTMPYPEYLQTPEWQERRARHLKSAGFRCQVCNAGNVQLDVHHRIYGQRGCEYFKDLIVLCHTCHAIFHRTGRLAEE